jgi:hypothetical protein
MLFQGGQLGLVFHHAEVVTFQVVIGDVVNRFSANRCSSSTILVSPTLQLLQLGFENPEKRV